MIIISTETKSQKNPKSLRVLEKIKKNLTFL